MLKQILTLIGIVYSLILNGQTGIGTMTPDPSAKLEISSTNKGFLPPRVTLTSVSDASTIPTPAVGLLVYNTGNNVNLAAGYYYWNGSNWATIATASSPNQTVDYVSVTRTGSDQTVNTNSVIVFNTINGGNIPYNTSNGLFSLTSGKTYKLIGGVSLSNGNTVAKEVNIVWKNAAGEVLGTKGELLSPSAAVDAAGNGIAYAIYTPTSNTTVSLNVNYSSSNTILWQNFTFASIEQIGSSAIVNPWVLSGNDVYNTTGNVGIGTNAPTSKLDISGDLKVSGNSNLNYLTVGTGTGDEGGEFSLARAQTNQSLGGSVNVDVYRNSFRIFEGGGSNRGVSIDLSQTPNSVGGELMWKKSGFVPAGTFISLDNIKATVTTSDNRGLSIGAVSTTFEADVSGYYTRPGAVGGSTTNNQTYTTTASGSFGNWHFPTHGDMVQLNLRDKTNNRFYRITMMIGASYISNFISIERLF